MAKIINIPVFDEKGLIVERTSQLINDGEFGTSKFIEEVDIEDIVQDIIITELQPQYHYFSNQSSILIEHGLNKYPEVTVLEGDEKIIPHSIKHTPDMNSLTVTLIPSTTGLIIIQ